MIRNRISLAIAFLLVGYNTEQNGSTKLAEAMSSSVAMNDKPVFEWQSFAKSEWHELHETRVAEDKSIIRLEIAQNDPQLGIGLMVDVGLLADSRGLTYLRPNKTIVANHSAQLNETGTTEIDSSQLIGFEFFKSEPDNKTDVTDVATWVELGRQREMEVPH